MRRFPALYRMPVFYLALSVGLTTAYASGWLAPREQTGKYSPWTSVSRTVATVLSPRSIEPPPESRPTVQPVTDSILRTAAGVRRKVLISGREVFPRPTPEGDLSGARLEPRAIRFIVGETPSQIQVGPASGEPDGWIARGAVVEWDSRLIARPTSRVSRPAVEIYAEQACLAAAMAVRACPRHEGRCPREEESDSTAIEGWPILSAASVVTGDGNARAIFEVAPLDREAVPTEAERLAPLRPALRQVYVAFVIDTTASMKATINVARDLATGLASDVSRRYGDVTLHLGLVEYRDDAPGLGFKARVAAPFTDAAGFRGVINSLEAAFREDSINGECVFDGMALAIPGSPGGLEWPGGRAGELATKLVVLLGDSPDHAGDLSRAAALAARARAAGISIAAVALDPPGSLPEAERGRLDAQWRTLADGSFRPSDPSVGFSQPLPPLSIRAEQSASLTARLTTLIDERIERARDLARLAAAEDEGRLAEYLTGRGLSMVQVAPILDDLRRRGQPVPRRTQRKAASIRRGWLAERMGDTQFVTVEVLLSRDELDVLIAELNALSQSSTTNGASARATAIQDGALLGELMFLDMDRARLTPAEESRRHASLPATPPVPRAASNDRFRAAALDLSRLKSTLGLFDPDQTIGDFASIPLARFGF